MNIYKTWTTTYKLRNTTMQTYKDVARARHYFDAVRDHCQEVTKQNMGNKIKSQK